MGTDSRLIHAGNECERLGEQTGAVVKNRLYRIPFCAS